jgi:hypothetical protein
MGARAEAGERRRRREDEVTAAVSWGGGRVGGEKIRLGQPRVGGGGKGKGTARPARETRQNFAFSGSNPRNANFFGGELFALFHHLV